MSRIAKMSVAGAVVLGLSMVAGAGDLAPPAGPVAPTMLPLDEVEPRTPIRPQDIPITINSPGSYFLTDNIVADGGAAIAITVRSSDVTLDLRGFTISNGTIPFLFTNAIQILAPYRNITIKDGTIRGSGGIGIDGSAAQHCRFTDLTFVQNGGAGLDAGNRSLVRGCQAIDNFLNGMDVGADSVVSESTAIDNGARGIVAGPNSSIVACSVYLNDGVGILTGDGGAIIGCTARQNGAEAGIFAGDGTAVHACASANNAGSGFDNGAAGGASFTGCAAFNNTLDGFQSASGSVFEACAAEFNGGLGFSVAGATALTGCTSSNNTLAGVSLSSPSAVMNCVSNDNGERGFALFGDTTVNNCVAHGNAGDGIAILSPDGAISGSLASNNGGDGVLFTSGPGSVVGTTSSNNTGNGFTAASAGIAFTGCNATLNTDGFRISGTGSSIHNCSALANSSDGYEFVSGGDGHKLSFSQATSNSANGINVLAESVYVFGCNAARNDTGIYVNSDYSRIDSNNTSDNTSGFGTDVDGGAPGSLIVRNSTTSGVFTINAGNEHATVQFVTDAAGGFLLGEPWANIDY